MQGYFRENLHANHFWKLKLLLVEGRLSVLESICNVKFHQHLKIITYKYTLCLRASVMNVKDSED